MVILKSALTDREGRESVRGQEKKETQLGISKITN